MRFYKIILNLFLIQLLHFTDGIAQADLEVEKQIKEYKTLAENSKDDSVKVMSLINWDNLIYMNDPKLDLELNDRIILICKNALKKNLSESKRKFFLKKMAFAYNGKAINVSESSNFKDAIYFYTEALKIYEKVNYQNGIANVYTNMAGVYAQMQMHDKSLELLLKAEKISLQKNDEQNLASLYNNLGNAYLNKDEYFEAEKMYLKSIKYCRKLGLHPYQGSAENNLGNVHSHLAEEYFSKKDKVNQFKEYDLALVHYRNSFRIYDSLKSEGNLSLAMMNIADILYKQGKLKEAEPLAEKAMSIVKRLNYSQEIRECSNILYMIYKLQGKTEKALTMYELYITLKDSILSEENRLEVLRKEAEYEYEKRAAEDSIKNLQQKKITDAEMAEQKAQGAKKDLEIENKKYQQYLLFGGLVILILFLAFIYNRFRITKKQKNIIEKQKAEVEKAHHQLEEKNKEVMDSINYAQRIQTAILPPDEIIKESYPQSFILYNPKDIVAGDFYWIHTSEKYNYIAACDCTGHGVPGALVSVICHGALNRSVNEFGLIHPKEILNKTREIVIEEFSKSQEEVKDGMDISLCAFSKNMNKIVWSGANNPLWIIRNKELISFSPDKQPIGKFATMKPFSELEIDVFKGDFIVLFTDGYADQFGGVKGKKFKYSALQNLLLNHSEKSTAEIKNMLTYEFDLWKGNLEQVDDVCIIGIKL